jgi:hypothetical protein
MLGIVLIAEHHHFHWASPPETHRSSPLWLGRLLLTLMATVYAYYGILPWIFKRSPVSPTHLFFKLFLRTSDDTSDQHTGKFKQKS